MRHTAWPKRTQQEQLQQQGSASSILPSARLTLWLHQEAVQAHPLKGRPPLQQPGHRVGQADLQRLQASGAGHIQGRHRLAASAAALPLHARPARQAATTRLFACGHYKP